MKKFLSLALAAVMAVSLFAGCGGNNDATTPSGDKTPDAGKEGTTITMWTMWNAAEPQGVVLQAAADAFKEQTGNTVKIEWKGREMNKIILAALEAGEKIDLFEEDYTRISNTYGDYVMDLTDMAAAAKYEEQSYPGLNDQVRAWTGGKLTSIVEQPQVGGVFYNKDAFADAGVEVPANWTEFLTVCEKLKAAGYYPLALDAAYADFTFGYHLARVIGEPAAIELTLNGGWSQNEGAVKAADQIIEFVKAGYLADGAPDQHPASQNKLGIPTDGKKAAMVVCAQYVIGEVDGAAVEPVNWGMFNYPEVEGGVDPSNAFLGANSLAIPAKSENAQVAFDFAMFLTSGEFDQRMANEAKQPPADPRNTAPAVLEGSVETLLATKTPLKWACGLNDNGELITNIKDELTALYAGKYETGADFAAAMDALYK